MENQRPHFKHFLITFFNLKIWKEDKTHHATQTPEWLEERFRLFEEFCLPSVERQTNKNFIWLCLFDKDTPAEFKQRVDGYAQKIAQMRPCYYSADEASEYLSKDEKVRSRFIRTTVRELLDDDDEFVITSNLDNDDALNVDYIERVQRQFLADRRHTLYSFVRGMQYFVKLDAVVAMRYPHNHFLTLVEDAKSDFRTVKFYTHGKARKVLPNVDITDKAYWLEVVHGHNISNDLRITSRVKYSPCLGAVDLGNFGLDKKLSAGHNLGKFLTSLPAYFIRIAVWRLKKKLSKN